MSNLAIFAGPSLPRALATIANRVLDRATNLPPSAWEPRADTPNEPRDVVAELLASVSLAVPVLNWNARILTATEQPVTIREQQPTRASSGTVRVPGIRVVASVPFAGSSLLLSATPSKRFVGGFDSAVRVRPAAMGTGHVDVNVTGRHMHPDDLERHLAKTSADIETHIGYARADLITWELKLADRLRCETDTRAGFLAELDALAVGLSPAASGDRSAQS